LLTRHRFIWQSGGTIAAVFTLSVRIIYGSEAPCKIVGRRIEGTVSRDFLLDFFSSVISFWPYSMYFMRISNFWRIFAVLFNHEGNSPCRLRRCSLYRRVHNNFVPIKTHQYRLHMGVWTFRCLLHRRVGTQWCGLHWRVRTPLCSLQRSVFSPTWKACQCSYNSSKSRLWIRYWEGIFF
jgi:hypothetical protein